MTSTEKWKTESIYVDKETAEVIKKNSVQNGDYILIKTTKYYEKDGNINKRIYHNECRRSKQRKLW